MLIIATREIELLFQPKSATIGINITPIENWAPELKKSMTKDAARTNHP